MTTVLIYYIIDYHYYYFSLPCNEVIEIQTPPSGLRATSAVAGRGPRALSPIKVSAVA